MKMMMLNWKCRSIGWFGIHSVRETLGDAVLCGVCGFLYGIIFGGLGAQVCHETSRIFWIAGISALGGCAMGTLFGVLGNVFQSHKSTSIGQGEPGVRRSSNATAIS